MASAQFNKSGETKANLYWQDEYAVFSFDYKRLPNYIQYVERQKEHHSQNTEIFALERTTGEGVGALKDQNVAYTVLQNSWMDEFNDYV